MFSSTQGASDNAAKSLSGTTARAMFALANMNANTAARSSVMFITSGHRPVILNSAVAAIGNAAIQNKSSVIA
jgi:hypothetical protein